VSIEPEFAPTSSFAGGFANVLNRRESLQFHFTCYALCEISFYEYEDDKRSVPDGCTLLGFWLTQEEADLASRGHESRLRAEHEAQYRATNGRWPAWPWNDPGYTPRHYEIVPLSSVRFDDLMDLDLAIEAAAKARVSGVGVEAVQKGGVR
jgi:hypothetical protein